MRISFIDKYRLYQMNEWQNKGISTVFDKKRCCLYPNKMNAYSFNFS